MALQRSKMLDLGLNDEEKRKSIQGKGNDIHKISKA
jgi:hypothetical protein